jgi:PKHD-type hydroxylase
MWSATLPLAYCQHIIERAERVPPSVATIGFNDGYREDNDFRRSVIRWLDPKGGDHDITTKVMQYVDDANRSCFAFDLWGITSLQFTEYHASNAGHYDWHQDTDLANKEAFDRKLSVVIQLSDPSQYEGGDFEFLNTDNPDASFKQAGSVLVFPSFLVHRVLPVTRGIRRSLVTWVEGPKLR